MSVTKYDIVSILENVLSELTPTVYVTGVVDNGDGTYTLSVCSSSYLRTGSIFEVNGNTYKVVSFINDTTVVVKGGSPILGTFELRPPLFITDTPQGANNESKLRKTQLDRHPFIWLLENFPTDFDNTKSNTVADARIRLFFLDVAPSNQKWRNKDHRNECIKPMRNLVDDFLQAVQDKISGNFSAIGRNYTVTDRPRFGIYSSDRGNTQGILSESLSGVELDISIPIQDWASECCDCEPLPIFDDTSGLNFGLNEGLN